MAFLAVCFVTGIASAQVTVSSPVPGVTLTSPVHVAASARSNYPITAVRIYLDNVSVFLASTAQISTNVSAAPGSHTLVIQAWDSTGAIFKTPVAIVVVTPPPTPTPTPIPTPTPVPATVLDQVQQWTAWQTCGSCGNIGGVGMPPTYTMIRGITYPTLSGSSSEFDIGGNVPYSNAYWYYRHQPVNAGLTSLRYEFDIYVPAASASAPQAIEFECQQRLNGYLYNFAWQAAFAENQWRVFNYDSGRWENAGIPATRLSGDTWHHVIAEYHNNSATHTTFHDALTIDGVRFPVNITHPATPTPAGNEFTNGFQLDLNYAPTPFKVFVDNMRITMVN